MVKATGKNQRKAGPKLLCDCGKAIAVMFLTWFSILPKSQSCPEVLNWANCKQNLSRFCANVFSFLSCSQRYLQLLYQCLAYCGRSVGVE